MSLNLSKWRQYLPKVIWGIVILLFALFVIRVMVWEHSYYTSKEGSERAVAEANINAGLEVDETDVTTDDLAKYTVAPDRPRYLVIDKLGVKSRVREVGTITTGELAVPASIFDTGWYSASSKPGTGGTLLLDGHNGGPTKTGVFKNLPKLATGDIVTIERGDGQIFHYKVFDNVTVPLTESDAYMSTAMTTPIDGVESLSIITCTGEWSQTKRTYLSRQFLRAVLVTE